MEYRILGRSGLAVSKLCLGTMMFGKQTSEDDSIEMIHRFIDYGGNFIDTADVYVGGKSEEIVGRAVKHRRNEVILATKVRFATSKNINDVGLSRKHIMEGVESSLRRLQTDYIDLYQVHVWDQITPIDETLRALDDLISSGKVRYIGCSNFLAWQLMKSLDFSTFNKYARFISLQPQYSLVSRQIDREILPLCIEENVGVIPWAPIAGGFLSNKYKRNEIPTEGRMTSNGTESAWRYRATEHNFIILDEIVQVAEETGKLPAQVSLSWLLKKQGITSPIFGARTLEQFEENMDVVNWQLEQGQWDRLDQISTLSEEYPYRFIEKFRRKM
jgi:aryl-alcohol dehydrogenase-like predicted oxidoreductase